MRNEVRATCWVVYRTKLPGKQLEVNAICEQGEWEAMERAQPGAHTLVRGKIASEAEAERLARGTSGDNKIHLASRS